MLKTNIVKICLVAQLNSLRTRSRSYGICIFYHQSTIFCTPRTPRH